MGEHLALACAQGRVMPVVGETPSGPMVRLLCMVAK